MAEILEREVVIAEEMNCLNIHKLPSLLGGWWYLHAMMDEIKCARCATSKVEFERKTREERRCFTCERGTCGRVGGFEIVHSEEDTGLGSQGGTKSCREHYYVYEVRSACA